MQKSYQDQITDLIYTALRSPGLLSPNQFNIARYSLNLQTRNQLLDPDISELEDFLIDNSGLPGTFANTEMLEAFGDVIYTICNDPETPLQLNYQNLSWLLSWLNIHHPPAFFGEDPDSPLQALQMAAALGFGEWAATFSQIENGVEILLDLASSPLWRLRDVAVLGLQRLVKRAWKSTLRRLKYRTMRSDHLEWRAIVLAISDATILDGDEDRVISALENQQQALRMVYLEPDAEGDEAALLVEALSSTPANIVKVNPSIGFAQLAVWANWSSPVTRQIVRSNLTHLQEWPEEVSRLEAILDS